MVGTHPPWTKTTRVEDWVDTPEGAAELRTLMPCIEALRTGGLHVAYRDVPKFMCLRNWFGDELGVEFAELDVKRLLSKKSKGDHNFGSGAGFVKVLTVKRSDAVSLHEDAKPTDTKKNEDKPLEGEKQLSADDKPVDESKPANTGRKFDSTPNPNARRGSF